MGDAGDERARRVLRDVFAYEWTGDEKCLGTVRAWYEFFDRYCRQVYGVAAMDEGWGWRGGKKRSATGLIFVL